MNEEEAIDKAWKKMEKNPESYFYDMETDTETEEL